MGWKFAAFGLRCALTVSVRAPIFRAVGYLVLAICVEHNVSALDHFTKVETDFEDRLSRFDEALLWRPSFDSFNQLPGQSADAAGFEEDSVLTMKQLVISGERLIELNERSETPVQSFIRTGTLAEHVGKKFTSRLWVRGDRGIGDVMISLSW